MTRPDVIAQLHQAHALVAALESEMAAQRVVRSYESQRLTTPAAAGALATLRACEAVSDEAIKRLREVNIHPAA